MTQRLKADGVHEEEPGSVPSSHLRFTTLCKFQGIFFWLSGPMYTCGTYAHIEACTYTHKKINILKTYYIKINLIHLKIENQTNVMMCIFYLEQNGYLFAVWIHFFFSIALQTWLWWHSLDYILICCCSWFAFSHKVSDTDWIWSLYATENEFAILILQP